MDEQNTRFSTEEAAIYLNIAAGTLENWRGSNRGPVYYKPAGRVYYIKSDLDKWIKEGIRNDQTANT